MLNIGFANHSSQNVFIFDQFCKPKIDLTEEKPNNYYLKIVSTNFGKSVYKLIYSLDFIDDLFLKFPYNKLIIYFVYPQILNKKSNMDNKY